MQLKTYSYTDDAFSICDLMNNSECQDWITRAERVGFDQAPITASTGDELNQSVRNNSRVIIEDVIWAERLWERIKNLLPNNIPDWVAVGLNERFRIYRYKKHQQFKKHSDGSFQRSQKQESKLTFMVYLNESFEGGATDFGAFKVWPETGMGLCFKHSLSHEGMVVTNGIKYALRSDVMYET